MRKSYAVKEKFIKDEVEKTKHRFMGESREDGNLTCALDEMMRREILLSEKEGRAPIFHSRAMYDEVLSFDTLQDRSSPTD
jgi:hypothetical protein